MKENNNATSTPTKPRTFKSATPRVTVSRILDIVTTSTGGEALKMEDGLTIHLPKTWTWEFMVYEGQLVDVGWIANKFHITDMEPRRTWELFGEESGYTQAYIDSLPE